MENSGYLPVYQVDRGNQQESIHYGAAAVVNSQGELISWYADPKSITYMRSAAKPFQALPFIERGGHDIHSLLPAEISLICASHNGTDEHVAYVLSIQSKTGVQESDLKCGIHLPMDEATAERFRQQNQKPTPNRHNCSGKHTGMLAFAKMQGWSIGDYLDPQHPVQQSIIETLADMCSLSINKIIVGIDGCSAPNFAIPLENTALAFARLVNPSELSPERAAACKTIVSAMISNPVMVAGQGRFDTRLMEVTNGRVLAKAGAEGFQGIGVLPGAINPDSPALGIALKISDGDPKGRARPAVCLELLWQLGVLTSAELMALSDFGPTQAVKNWRKLLVGGAQPCFTLSGVN